MIFQGIWTSIAKKPYIFVIFQGGGGAGAQGPDPVPPPLNMCMYHSNKIVNLFQSKGPNSRMGDKSDRSGIFKVQVRYVVPTIIGITHGWEITQTGQLYYRFK